MTQQVVHARVIAATKDTSVDYPSFGLTIEERGTDTSLDLSACDTAITAFVNAWASNTSFSLSGQMTIEYYDVTTHLDGSPAGSPIHLHTGSFSPGAASHYMPEGVTAAVSYRADYGTDVEFAPGTRPRARDRNRFYLWPITNLAMSQDAGTGRTILSNTFITTVLNAVSVNLLGIGTAPTHVGDLVVWSRKNASVKPIVDIWMDDRPDYQRRRSDQSTLRSTISV